MRGTKRLKEIMQSADYSNLPVSGATIYSNIDPTCCSPGKSLIATNFMASYDTFAQTLDSDGGRGVKYHELKDKVEKQLLDVMVDATGLSDLADHIEVVEVGTPITFERYTENLGGSFMGWRNTPIQGAFSSFSPRTPSPNLFQCGQWLGVGGVASVMTTGLDAAKMATRYLDRLGRESKLETTDKMATDSPASGSIGGVSIT
jgi:phytoene dehydrogenase-like protein